MEDLSRIDVQLIDKRWAQGRKTNRTTWQLVPAEMSLRTAVLKSMYNVIDNLLFVIIV